MIGIFYRRSLKGRRDPDAFAKEAQNQHALQQLADAGLINLFFSDESGCTTVPSVPYAWQPAGTTLELPSFKSKRLNVLGFMSRGQQAYFHTTEGTAGTAQVAAAVDGFASRYALEYAIHGKPCVWSPWATRLGTPAARFTPGPTRGPAGWWCITCPLTAPS